jgi:hypothetical protein
MRPPRVLSRGSFNFEGGYLMKSGFNQINDNEYVYIPEKYSGPLALNIKPSKECDEYHKNSYIQINIKEKAYIKKASI